MAFIIQNKLKSQQQIKTKTSYFQASFIIDLRITFDSSKKLRNWRTTAALERMPWPAEVRKQSLPFFKFSFFVFYGFNCLFISTAPRLSLSSFLCTHQFCYIFFFCSVVFQKEVFQQCTHRYKDTNCWRL